MFGCFDERNHFWDITADEKSKFYWQELKLDENGETKIVKISEKKFLDPQDCIRDAKEAGGMTCEPGLESDLVM